MVKIKKKTAFIIGAFVTTGLAVASVFKPSFDHRVSLGLDVECNHQGNHYAYHAPTQNSAGNKEFYVCCKCHEKFLKEPAKGTWQNVSFAPSLNSFHDAYIPKQGDFTITTKTMSMYLNKSASYFNTSTLYFVDSEENVPYMDLYDFACLFAAVYGNFNVSSSGTYDYVYTLNNTNATFNILESTITFDNYSKFMQHSSQATPCDVLNSGSGFDFLTLDASKNMTIYSTNSTVFNLSNYGIYFVKHGTKYLAPLATLNDVFLSYWGFSLFTNGSELYFSSTGPGEFTSSAKTQYYASTETNRTFDLASFTYRELCFAFDMKYGLKSERGITSTFDAFIKSKNLKNDMLSLDGKTACDAFTKFTYELGDCHTSFEGPSSYAGSNYSQPSTYDVAPNSRYTKLCENYYKHLDQRSADLSTVYAYETYQYGGIDNTAFITFDNFNLNYSSYSKISDQEKYNRLIAGDTIGLFSYCDLLIKNNANLKNLVIDISCNTGGVIGVCSYIASWINGSSAIAMKSAVDGCLSRSTYSADVNLDGTIDSNDVLRSNINVYLLTSQVSFSCGNLLPNLLKNNSRVKIIGARSYGGACPVGVLPIADGAFLKTSCEKIMGEFVDSNFVNFEAGAELDYEITSVTNFYKRANIVNFINSL